MARVLVVDDSAMDRRLAGGLLAKRAGIEALYAENGRQALELVASSAPDVVLTDLQMPEMDGLELVEAIRARHGAVPVVLMTAHGSEEIAVRALQRGAASYVSKRSLARELVATIENVLEVTKARHDEERALACFVSAESHFELDNDLTKVPLLIAFLEGSIGRVLGVDETAWIQIGVALREALVNAIVHGNLEVDSALRESDGPAFDTLCARRATEAPWAARRVQVVARHGRDAATFVVKDQGPGFDPASLPDPTEALMLEQVHGRGILLIRTFMDEVRHNAAGNEITMVKRFSRSS
jgi:CheY-like chemotaxis protein/anti-sigma regulatory factor (Ser/Thr protein kinase)